MEEDIDMHSWKLTELYSDRWRLEADMLEEHDLGNHERAAGLQCSIDHIKAECNRIELLLDEAEATS